MRVNAIVPASQDHCEPGVVVAGLKSEPEIAALALRLSSSKGKTMSGLVFDADLV